MQKIDLNTAKSYEKEIKQIAAQFNKLVGEATHAGLLVTAEVDNMLTIGTKAVPVLYTSVLVGLDNLKD